MLNFISGGAIAGIIIGAIVLIFVIWLIATYNGLVRNRNNVDESFSTMDVYLKKRYDLIPNLVETVKGYAKHEKETLEKVMQARNVAMQSTTPEQKIENNNALQGTLKSLFAVAENYPDLKANQNFLDLQASLKEVEGEIANSRKYYNGTVKIYNNAVQTVPTNIVAKWFKFTPRTMYVVDDVEERKNVKVSF